MSGPETVAAVALHLGRTRSTAGTPAEASGVGTTTASAASAATITGVTGVAFTSALATASSAGPVDGAWSIPWAAGTAPSQDASVAAARHRAAAHAASGMLLNPTMRTAGAIAVTSPVDGTLTQGWGPTDSVYSQPATVNGVHYDHFHDGVDYGAPLGTPVRAMAAGTVEFAGTYPDGARVVRIRHADGAVSLYAHLKGDLDVKEGDTVAAGQQIGVVGMTGNTTGPHLHLELTIDGQKVDPLPYLQAGSLPAAEVTSAGRSGAALPASAAPVATTAAATTAALARFDAVADGIPYAAEIRAAAVKANVDPLLLASLVKAESAFHPTSVSRCGALGLCQLMPANVKALGVTDPFDPAQNLDAGARYLAGKLHRYGRVDVALASYQAGSGAVAAAGGGIPDSPTTHRYITKILTTWAGYMEAAA